MNQNQTAIFRATQDEKQREAKKSIRGCKGPKVNLIAGCKLVLSLAIAMCLFFASSATLNAQGATGTSVGTVTDNTGAALAGATVTLTNVATGDARTAQSNATGGYQFVNVQPGNYKIDVEAAGFKHFTVNNIVIQVGTSTRIDPKVEIGATVETVEVTSQAALLETQQSTTGQVVEGRAVSEMPLNGRDIMNLVEVAPGVVPMSTVSPADAATGARGGFAGGNYMISGGIPNAGVQFVDGGSINTGYINSLAFVPSQDAIQEFNVEANNISPEYGGTEDGVTVMVTKSGTNSVHFTVADYFRNAALNANTFFNNQATPKTKRPPFTQNQYAATIGGPIKKDKLFYFGSFEGSREKIGASTTYSVPTALMRAGTLGGSIIDPGTFDSTYTTFTPYNAAYITANGCPSGDTQSTATNKTDSTTSQVCMFTGGQVPSNRVDPTAANMLAWWPTLDPSITSSSNNYIVNLITHPSYSQYLGRIDWTINDKQRFFGRYLYQTELQDAAPVFQLAAYLPNANHGWGKAHQAVLGYDYTINPTTILDVRLAYLRDETYQAPNCYPNCGSLVSTLTGWPSAQLAQMRPGPFVPRINSVAGLTQLGGAQYIPVNDDDDAISGSMTKILGRHTLKFGGEFRRQPNNYGQDNQTYDEQFAFTTAFTGNTNLSLSGATGAAIGGNAFANYLLGFPQQTNTLTAFYPASMTYYAGAYLGDIFQLNSKLTINAGIRWEYPGYWTERNNRQAVWLPNATNPLASNAAVTAAGLSLKGDVSLVATPAYPGRTNLNPHYDMFSPRLGFAYRLTDRNVLRSGFGIVYAEESIIQQNAQPYNSPVNTAQTQINTTTQPVNALHNPFPTGILQPAGRGSNYETTILGQLVDVPFPQEPSSYIEQWNVDYEHDFGHQIMIDVAYVGSKANHLPAPGGSNDNGIGVDQLANGYDICGTDSSQSQCVVGGGPITC